jgi:predicted SnoaL-like aldol condensation-catalyzing enzyme
MAFNQSRPREAMKLYAGDVYIQHNPGVKDGKEGLIEYFGEMDRRYPGKRARFKRDRRGQLRLAPLLAGMAPRP